MIISKQKDFDDLLNSIDGKPVFIVGCSECATLCHTGGEEEILAMKKKMEDRDIEVTGWVVLDPACHLLNDKRLFREHEEEIAESEKILVLACGNGVQTVSEIFEDMEVIAGNDTLFLGEIKRANNFEIRCVMCGECVVDRFSGLCPISRCPKQMLNGPCGGSIDGKCEINPDFDCVWDIIYNRLNKKGELHRLKKIRNPKEWSVEMRRIL